MEKANAPEGISLEDITLETCERAYDIDRSDISEDFVDTVPYLVENINYGAEHDLIGHAFFIKDGERYIGTILLGEGLIWGSEPEELKERPFYRLVFFVLDKAYRGKGIGEWVLQETIERVCRDFGTAPILLGCHKDNVDAARFYERHGFVRTDCMDGSDIYYVRGL